MSFTQVLSAVVLAVVTGILAGLLRKWLASRHTAALSAGKAFRFDASLRGNVAPYPRHFRAGWVYVGVGSPSWKPRFGLLRRQLGLPTSAVVEKVRLLSLGEILRVSADCRVVVAHAGDLDLELAILAPEVETALHALESSTGGGWRLQVTK